MGVLRAQFVRRGCSEFRVMAMLRRKTRFKILRRAVTRLCASGNAIARPGGRVRARVGVRVRTAARARVRARVGTAARARVLPRSRSLVRPQHKACQSDGDNTAGEDVPNERVLRLLTSPVGYKVLASDEEWCLISVEPGQGLTILGCLWARCLSGRACVLEYEMTPGCPAIPIYSPTTHSALTLQALPPLSETFQNVCLTPDSSPLPKFVTTYLHKADIPSCNSVLLLEKLASHLVTTLVTSAIVPKLFSPNKVNNVVQLYGVDAWVLPSTCGVTMHPSSKDAIATVLQAALGGAVSPVVLVCGKRNIGKSTLIRCLMNTLLNHLPCLYHLECDVGQTEFMPPGFVSLHAVTKPLLGPPFTHQAAPLCAVYYGDVSPDHDLDRYVAAIRLVMEEMRAHPACPLLVNTNGWVKGPGLMVLADICRIVRPTHVIQLAGLSFSSPMNAISSSFLQSAEGWITHRAPVSVNFEMEPQSEHRLLNVTSSFSRSETSVIMLQPSSVYRDLAVVSYLSQLLPPSLPPQPLLAYCLPPYQVKLADIALHIAHCDVPPPHILYALDLALVGLCHLDQDVQGGPLLLEETPTCISFGLENTKLSLDDDGCWIIVSTTKPPAALPHGKNNAQSLSAAVTLKHKDRSYQIYIATEAMTCFICGEHGHLKNACPKPNIPGDESQRVEPNRESQHLEPKPSTSGTSRAAEHKPSTSGTSSV
uniref:polynucleotide 5'-hydroxyl-kinase NOL9 n=1 Tax=Myxine glutinosa TaxID=7769 RepID=UPI00358FCA3B